MDTSEFYETAQDPFSRLFSSISFLRMLTYYPRPTCCRLTLFFVVCRCSSKGLNVSSTPGATVLTGVVGTRTVPRTVPRWRAQPLGRHRQQPQAPTHCPWDTIVSSLLSSLFNAKCAVVVGCNTSWRRCSPWSDRCDQPPSRAWQAPNTSPPPPVSADRYDERQLVTESVRWQLNRWICRCRPMSHVPLECPQLVIGSAWAY